MGNKSSRRSRPRRPRIHRDDFGPYRAVDPSWRDLVPAASLDPLELIASEAIDRSGTANGKLSLYEAWEVAMAWHEPLLNKVCLVKECQGPKSSIIENIAWVRFKVRLDDHSEVSVARAAAVTWMKLASCPGYGGQENPVFWKCVFGEYCKRLDPSDFDRVDNSIVYSLDDSVEFFSRPGELFPRYMVDGNTSSAAERNGWASGLELFCGAGGEHMDPKVKSRLDRLTKRIDYFISKNLTSRAVDICLGRLNSDDLSALCEVVPAIIDELQTKQVDTPSPSTATHLFRLVQLNFIHDFKLRGEADVEKLCQLMRSSSVAIGPLHLSISEDTTLSTSARAELVRCLLGLDSTQAKTTSIRLTRHTDAVLGSFLSAIPHATSPHTFCFDVRNLDGHDLPWLGYAMFHPDTAKSSWKALELGDVQFSQQSVTVMEVMAAGNNLEALLHGKNSANSSYCSAKLAPRAVVKAKPSSLAETIVQACDISTRVDVCSPSPANPLSWSRWVSVVIPGFGFGWVRSRDLIDVHIRAPSPASLHSLRLSQLYIHPTDDTMDGLADWIAETEEADRESSGSLPGVLALVGSSLRYLDILYFADIESTPTLSAALLNCPSLAVLVVKHQGWLWHGTVQANEQSLPCLEQLDLSVEGHYGPAVFETPHSDHLRSSLSRLTTLRVRADTDSQFIHSQPAITAVLSDVASLHYFHCLDTSGHVLLDRYLPRSYTQTHAWSSQLLSQLSWKDDDHLYVCDQSRRRRVAAFLSVGDTVSRALSTEATAEGEKELLARLDRGVISHIFQFVSNRVKRKITVEPKSQWLVRLPDP